MKRLGRRLRKAEQPSPDDIAMYDAYRESFNADLHDVMGALQSLFPDSPPAARRKTLDSVVAKLKRGTTDLGSMQDIAGCRINVPGLDDQDDAVARIQERFEARKTDDLRDRPHSGYRAVHVIVAAPHGRWVEIQVRTALQDLYAQLSERMADAFGIVMKYGGGDPFAREILQLCADRAFQLDQVKRGAEMLAPGTPASDLIRCRVEEETGRFLTIVQAIMQALEPSKERAE